MTCTHKHIEPAGLSSKIGRAVFRGEGFTAIVTSAHRGGCLFVGSIFVRNDSNGKCRAISTTDGTGCYAELGDSSAYLLSLAKKLVG